MKEKRRTLIQALSALLTNANLGGFVNGTISRGDTKHICVPGLNCYSCPGAIGSCPIGSLQAVLGGAEKTFPYYVVGTLLLFGALFGRLICGFLCPFGFVQDLLNKIPHKKRTVPKKIDRILRYLKYAVLLFFVILLPLLMTGNFGIGDPAFCKYICPAGTLEGGIPLVAMNQSLREAVGFLFSWKVFLLVLTVLASIMIYRPFCKYICPLGAIYGLMNRFSLYQMKVDTEHCTHCGVCSRTCKMQVDITKNINSAECIRCGACKNACPSHCIQSGFKISAKDIKRSNPSAADDLNGI